MLSRNRPFEDNIIKGNEHPFPSNQYLLERFIKAVICKWQWQIVTNDSC